MPVQGRWPAALQGSFYRIGPARRELGGVAMDHWFDGDGMLQAFRLEAGTAASPPRIAHRGALLATPKLVAEEAAGRLLYSGFATALPDARPLSGSDSLNPANINQLALPQTGSLYTLWEAGSALEVDRVALQSRGFKAWSPETRGAPFSAHPRVAPTARCGISATCRARASCWCTRLRPPASCAASRCWTRRRPTWCTTSPSPSATWCSCSCP